MKETIVTISGNVIADPVFKEVGVGNSLLSLRVASNSRKFDQDEQEWTDGPSLYVTVTCWGKLAIRAYPAIQKGKPIIVTGFLSTKEYVGADGSKKIGVELKANDLGLSISRHDVRYVDSYDSAQLNEANKSLESFSGLLADKESKGNILQKDSGNGKYDKTADDDTPEINLRESNAADNDRAIRPAKTKEKALQLC